MIAARPMIGSCMNMKTRIVSSVPPWNAGSANASPMKPPIASTSAVIIVHDLAGGDPAEMGQREAQDAREEVVAQPPQHALGDDALVDVDDVFEAAVDQHQAQEHAAQQEQVLDLRERDSRTRCGPHCRRARR